MKRAYLGDNLVYKSSTQLLLSGIKADYFLFSKDGLNYEYKKNITPSSTTVFTSFGTINGKIWAANTNGIYITEDLVNYTLLIAKPSKSMILTYKNNIANIGSQFVGIFESSSSAQVYFNYTNEQGTSWTSNTKLDDSGFQVFKLITFNNKFLALARTGIIHLDVNATSNKIKKCNFTLLDGSTFTTLDSVTIDLDYFVFDGAIYNNKLYVFMHKEGKLVSDYRDSIFESTDGTNYTEICTIPTSSNGELDDGIVGLTIENNTITFLGPGGASYSGAYLYKSLDFGNTWNKLKFPRLSSNGRWDNTNLLKFKDFFIYNGIATESSASSGGVSVADQNIIISADGGTTWSKVLSGGAYGTPSSFVCLETELDI